MNVLGLIPARGGSKGVPGKNIKVLKGHPLLAYTAVAALNSRLLTDVVLSTESEEIAEVGKRYGLSVPFLRPIELAQDETPTYPVIMHALEKLGDQGKKYDAVCLLQPVCPFRTSEVIDDCIRLYQEKEADTVITTSHVPSEYSPYFVYFEAPDSRLTFSLGGSTLPIRRQDAPPCVRREGSVYLTSVETLKTKASIYGDKIFGLPVSPENHVNIDTIDDWARAERLMGKRSLEL